MPAAGADNGCEQNALNANGNGELNCGGCGNNCNMQGGSADGFECDQGAGTQKFCGCSQTQECGVGGNGACNLGLCTCTGQATPCAPGEACAAGNLCTCNGGAGCGVGQTCCVSPAGCQNLLTDATSCGACGHECSTGFVCTNGACRCDDNNDCNAGTGGTFTCNVGTGVCTCGAATCTAGQRCQPNGQCG
jgi:hypothetical protein